MIDFPQITGLAVNQARQAGHERGTAGHLDFVEKAFNVKVMNDTCTVYRVMSRKKDFIPAIGQVLSMGQGR